MDIRRIPGSALGNNATEEGIYTPPQGEVLLRDKLGNWERFPHQAEEIDPLIRMAVMHSQFAAIYLYSAIAMAAPGVC